MTPHDPVYFLLVDDREENLIALEALLKREGLVLLKARSGRKALELLLEHEVALALIDVQMPEMDGFELAELMRGTKRTKCAPIIFLTAGNADQQRRFRGYEAGAVDFIQKPIEPDILKSKADVFFELYRRRQEVLRQRDELSAATIENARLLKESQQYADALKEADRRKDEFLATLAHELRNPLAPIRNSLRILQLNPQGEQAEQARDIMERQLSHMVRIIDDLLDLSRVSKGKIELRKERLSVQTVVQSALETSRPLIEFLKHKLTLDMTDEELFVEGDLTRLAQTVSNLLNNAAKYTPEGGAIELAVMREGEEAVIRVTDNGIGLEKHMLNEVFELFTQVDSGLERSQGGLGIGLALVKHLVEMHNGVIKAESAGLGKGSSFSVRLPLAQMAEDVEANQQFATEEGTAAPLNILVVDDNVPSAKTAGWMLEMIGHKPTLAHNGEEALELAFDLKPDVILLDIGMPGLNGYDTCRELRKNPDLANTFIIAQTGWGQKRDRDMAREAGFNYHLIKPVDFDELTKVLATVKSGEDLKAANL